MIRYDEAQRSVVAICDCGAREVLSSMRLAYDWSAAHLIVCQIEVERARTLAAVRAGRARYR